MALLDFIKEYWVIISTLFAELGIIWGFVCHIRKASMCALRNDILDIYDRCKANGKITRYQLQSINYSYDVYKRLKGNSFVGEIIERIKDFELVD